MRVSFEPHTFGMKKKTGWLVTFDGSIVASLYVGDGDTVGLNWGYEVPWICGSQTWDDLDSAKEEFSRIAHIYAQGVTPDQLSAMIEDARHPLRNRSEQRARDTFRAEVRRSRGS